MRTFFRLPLAALFLFMVVSHSLPTQAAEGFRDMKWGATVSDIQKTKKLIMVSKDSTKSTSTGVISGDNLVIGGANLVNIGYTFWKDSLIGVLIFTKGEIDFNELKKASIEKFGKCSSTRSGMEENCGWEDEESSTLLFYHHDTTEGGIIMSSKRMLAEMEEGSLQNAKRGAMKDF